MNKSILFGRALAHYISWRKKGTRWERTPQDALFYANCDILLGTGLEMHLHKANWIDESFPRVFTHP